MPPVTGVRHASEANSPVFDRLSALPPELECVPFEHLAAVDIFYVHLLNRTWQQYVLGNGDHLAKRIKDEDHTGFCRQAAMCNLSNVDFLIALTRFDELFNIYNEAHSTTKSDKLRAFGLALAFAVHIPTSPLYDPLDVALTAVRYADSLFFEQSISAYGSIPGCRSTLLWDKDLAILRISFASMDRMRSAVASQQPFGRAKAREYKNRLVSRDRVPGLPALPGEPEQVMLQWAVPKSTALMWNRPLKEAAIGEAIDIKLVH